MGDPEAARVHLERAWQSGYHTPDVAYALGLALGALYHRERETVDGIGSKELREARRREIQEKYRDPATFYLRQSGGSDQAVPEYAEGLLAFYEKRYDAGARAGGGRAGQGALAVRGPAARRATCTRSMSREKHETGDAAGSAAAVEQATSAYTAAADYARSDPAAREGLCQTGIQRMERKLYQGADLAALFAEVSRTCERGLAADPEQRGRARQAREHPPLLGEPALAARRGPRSPRSTCRRRARAPGDRDRPAQPAGHRQPGRRLPPARGLGGGPRHRRARRRSTRRSPGCRRRSSWRPATRARATTWATRS